MHHFTQHDSEACDEFHISGTPYMEFPGIFLQLHKW